MKKFLTGLALLSVLCAFFVETPAECEEELEYKTYRNVWFGYGLDYPDIFESRTETDNGAEFSGKAGEYTLTVWGADNVLEQDEEALLKECKERVAHIVEGSARTGKAYYAGNGFYAIEYSDDGGKDGVEHIFYEYGILNADVKAGFVLKYPKDEEARFAKIKKVMESWFRLPKVKLAAPDISAFSLKDGGVYKGGAQLEAAINEVPSDIKGPIRYWSAFGQQTSEGVLENETGVWFFAKDGACLRFLPLESEYECQGIIFSPDGEKFLLESGSGIRPDMTYVLYEFPEMRARVEIAGLRYNAVWIDPMRFVMTRTDDIREGGSFANLSYGLRVSVVMYDSAAHETVVLKEATDTRNYWLKKVIEDGGALFVTEESVKSQDDWSDEKKTKTRRIRVEIPAAG